VTPATTKTLIEEGYKVNIERSPERIFKDYEFEAVGAMLVPEGCWPSAPEDHLIIGLKELPEEDCMPCLKLSKPCQKLIHLLSSSS